MQRTTTVLIGLALVLGFGVPAPAQSGGAQSGVQIRLGGFFPGGGGDLWDANEEDFTLAISDFDDFSLGFSLVRAINNHVEVGLNTDFYDSTVFSAYRGWVDEDGFPIFHDTTLETIPVTLDLRLLPFGRYKVRGRGAVLRPVPYIGGGVGVNYWVYEETGDFLDFTFDPPVVFFDSFQDSDVAFQAHVLAGIEFPVGDSFTILSEGRYTWSDDNLNDDFAGLGKIELGGASFFFGGAFRF